MILNCNDLYEANKLGEIRSIDRWVEYPDGRKRFFKGRILKTSNDKNGYQLVTLSYNGKRITKKVHRLVWEAFNGEIPEGMQVNHINEDKTDNRLENLNLMTPKENINWGISLKRRAERQRNDKRSKPVLQFTLDGVLVKEWPSTKECGRNGFNQSAVSACCRGKLKTYKGYIWKYKNECRFTF